MTGYRRFLQPWQAMSFLAAAFAGCIEPGEAGSLAPSGGGGGGGGGSGGGAGGGGEGEIETAPPPDVEATTTFPCGEFTNVPLTCTSDLGTFQHQFDVRVWCDGTGRPKEVETAESAGTTKPFELGSECVLDTDDWVLDAGATKAVVDCMNPWGDGTQTRYIFTLTFTSNLPPIHGTLYLESIYSDSKMTYEPGYSDCKF